jgi:hypothetical protein
MSRPLTTNYISIQMIDCCYASQEENKKEISNEEIRQEQARAQNEELCEEEKQGKQEEKGCTRAG